MHLIYCAMQSHNNNNNNKNYYDDNNNNNNNNEKKVYYARPTSHEPARIGWLAASAFPTRRPAFSGLRCARAAHISLSLSPLQDILRAYYVALSRSLSGALSRSFSFLSLHLSPRCVLSTPSEKFCLAKATTQWSFNKFSLIREAGFVAPGEIFNFLTIWFFLFKHLYFRSFHRDCDRVTRSYVDAHTRRG